MSEIKKFGSVKASASIAPDMAKINALTLVELSEEDVFVFRIVACDDQVDREHERFTKAALGELAKLYVGKTVIVDHRWSAANQTARIYDAALDESDGVTRLVVTAYMLRNEQTAATIAAIEGGILKEVSVGCAVSRATCSICGTNKATGWCKHQPGAEYDGKACIVELDKPADAYEVSFVAVPAQRNAGVVKQYGGEDQRPQNDPAPADLECRKALALLELEEKI